MTTNHNINFKNACHVGKIDMACIDRTSVSFGSPDGEFVLSSLIGEGSNGQVFCSRNPRTNEEIAIKVTSYHNKDSYLEIEKLAAVQSRVGHPLLLSHNGWQTDYKNYYLFMEKCQCDMVQLINDKMAAKNSSNSSRSNNRVYNSDSSRNISTLLTNKNSLISNSHSAAGLDLDQCYMYLAQTISVLFECHRKGVFHRDIKPENIMIGMDGRVRLGDFGSALIMEPSANAIAEFSESVFNSGTKLYLAPELLFYYRMMKSGGEPYQQYIYYNPAAADTFALGVTFFIMVFGRRPILNEDGTLSQWEIYEMNRCLEPSLRHLICSMMESDPSRRMTLLECYHHPWMQMQSTFFKTASMNPVVTINSPPGNSSQYAAASFSYYQQ